MTWSASPARAVYNVDRLSMVGHRFLRYICARNFSIFLVHKIGPMRGWFNWGWGSFKAPEIISVLWTIYRSKERYIMQYLRMRVTKHIITLPPPNPHPPKKLTLLAPMMNTASFIRYRTKCLKMIDREVLLQMYSLLVLGICQQITAIINNEENFKKIVLYH